MLPTLMPTSRVCGSNASAVALCHLMKRVCASKDSAQYDRTPRLPLAACIGPGMGISVGLSDCTSTTLPPPVSYRLDVGVISAALLVSLSDVVKHAGRHAETKMNERYLSTDGPKGRHQLPPRRWIHSVSILGWPVTVYERGLEAEIFFVIDAPCLILSARIFFEHVHWRIKDPTFSRCGSIKTPFISLAKETLPSGSRRGWASLRLHLSINPWACLARFVCSSYTLGNI